MDTSRVHHGHVEADEQPGAFCQASKMACDDLGSVAYDLLAALAAERPPDSGEEQPEIVVYLRGRADGRTRIGDAVFLTNGPRRENPFGAIDVRLLHPFEELPRVGR